MDQSKAIVNLVHAGMRIPDICAKLKVPRSTVYYHIKKFKSTGSTDRTPGQGRKRSARSGSNVAKIEARISKDPFVSQRQLAREFRIAEGSVRNVMRHDLGVKSRARVKKHLVTQVSQDKRLEKAKNLVNMLKEKSHPVILFSDEKIFDVDSVSNSRMDRFLSADKFGDVPAHIKFKYQTKHPASIMMFGLVASDGKKMPPFFFPVGTKINSDVYVDLLKTVVKPWIKKTYSLGGNYVLQQDGAPCHTSRKTQQWLIDNQIKFWPKEIWPPNSPDLNPLDFSVWAEVARTACRKPHSSIDTLKVSIRTAWRNLTADYIRLTCSRFRPRLEAVVAADGGHIEA
jgi:transposase